MKKLALVLFVAIAFVSGFSTVASGQEQLEKAFKAAALPADAKGRWVVRTNINIYKSDATALLEASGDLELKGNVLEGHLGLRPPGGALINGNTMYFYVTKPSPATMRVRHDIAGKPFLGRPAEIVKLENRYRAPFLRGTVIWDGEECTFSIFFSPMQTTEKPKPVFSDPDPIPSAQKSIGARYKITGSVTFTNTEDGFMDSTCEVFGKVMLFRSSYGSGKNVKEYTPIFEIIPQDVTGARTFTFQAFIDDYDEDKSQFGLRGGFYDGDDGPPPYGIKTTTIGKYDDLMWPDPDHPKRVNLKQMAGKGASTYPGDRDSENAEVYITVTKISDLYKREPTKTVWTSYPWP